MAARYLGRLGIGFALTAAVVAGLAWLAPRIVGEPEPAGLIGLQAGIGIVATLRWARRELQPRPTP